MEGHHADAGPIIPGPSSSSSVVEDNDDLDNTSSAGLRSRWQRHCRTLGNVTQCSLTHRQRVALSSMTMVAVGMIGAIQTASNNRAGVHYGSFLLGTVLSFILGTIALLIVAGTEAVAKRMPACRFLRFNRRPCWWQLAGGVLGVGSVAASVGGSMVLGYAVFFVCAVSGQMLTGALIDHRAWFGVQRQSMSTRRASALVLCIIGAVVSIIDRLVLIPGSATPHSPQASGYSDAEYVLAVFGAVGAGIAWAFQAPVNRSMSELLPTKLQGSLMSFIVGTIIALCAAGILLIIRHDLATDLGNKFLTSQWWMYGGPLGAIHISSGILLLRVMGVSLYFVTLICGQLLGAHAYYELWPLAAHNLALVAIHDLLEGLRAGGAILDAVGFLNSPVAPASPTRIAGIVIVFLAATVLQGPSLLDACRNSLRTFSKSFRSNRKVAVAPQPVEVLPVAAEAADMAGRSCAVVPDGPDDMEPLRQTS